MKPAGRPKHTKPKRKLIAVRLRVEFVDTLKKIAARERLSQSRVLETCLSRYGKEVRL